jgi:N-acetylglucosaminyldiphosphoundecaprenol N-acetyl-beta-D-mannosaminyltransferase
VDEIARHRIGNVDFSVMRLSEAVRTVLAAPQALATDGHPGLAVHFCNAYNVALARSDAGYASLLRAGDLVLSDGVPITWVGRRAYPGAADSWERVYGPDVMRMTLEQSTPTGPRHYLLGGTEQALDALRLHIAQAHPQAVVVGAESPPFREPSAAELTARDERISASGAELVWVGLGTPRQDAEVRRLSDALPVVALAVGAAFDFLAGTKPQAPPWMQRNGLEWAFRLASEPGRLGRRYAWGNSIFALEAVRTLRATRG